MTYYNIAVYMHNGKLYHGPPGEKIWVYMDEKNNYYYGNVKVEIHYNNPAWNGRLQRTHSIRPLPGPVPTDKRKFSDLHGLIQFKL